MVGGLPAGCGRTLSFGESSSGNDARLPGLTLMSAGIAVREMGPGRDLRTSWRAMLGEDEREATTEEIVGAA